eukprot:GAFH01003044.1.p1 GENE.GAFH01003044.1~~GAFH01003044.1.p1  ORF type:complete len:260 (+),score=92.39 GAFH01003044.1:40-819(+)
MDSNQVTQQIQQMRNFIVREAEDKAAEIQSKAEEESEIEKQKIVDAAKAKYRKEFERRLSQSAVQRKIDLSKKVNKVRLDMLKQREATVQELIARAKAQMAQYVKDARKYKPILTNLIAEGLLELMEAQVTVRCRQEDLALVREVIPDALRLFHQNAQPDMEVAVDVDTTFLAAGPAAGNANPCSGGVLLHCRDGRIKLANTLDDRIQISMEGLLPEVKKILFPQSTAQLFDGLNFGTASPAPAAAGPAAAAAAAAPKH